MSTKQMLINEIEQLPPQSISEVYNFVSFIKLKQMQESDDGNIHFASENVLARDWLSPEEDEAWANL
jgi:hypothetical protein